MAVMPQPMKDYALGADKPDFATRIKGPLTPKNPGAPKPKMPFQKK
jgi:hypothetical protein